jgi:hypothetical protein
VSLIGFDLSTSCSSRLKHEPKHFIMVIFKLSLLSDDGSTTFSVVSFHSYFLGIVCFLAVCWIMKCSLASLVLNGVDYLIGAILEGPRMRQSISCLVEDILLRSSLQGAIASTVATVLRDDEMREIIASVVQDVLSDDRPLRGQIANIVRDVLHDGVVEDKIAEVVSRCLSNDAVAQGIVSAIKGTSFNVLNGASQKALSYVPAWALSMSRNRRFPIL